MAMRNRVGILSDQPARNDAVRHAAVRDRSYGGDVGYRAGVLAGQHADELTGRRHIRICRDGRAGDGEVAYGTSCADRGEHSDAAGGGDNRRDIDSADGLTVAVEQTSERCRDATDRGEVRGVGEIGDVAAQREGPGEIRTHG